jgi:hypothetical protein
MALSEPLRRSRTVWLIFCATSGKDSMSLVASSLNL